MVDDIIPKLYNRAALLRVVAAGNEYLGIPAAAKSERATAALLEEAARYISANVRDL